MPRGLMAPTAEQIATVRQFNRDWTRRIGVLGDSLLGLPYSLAEARVLYELAQRADVTPSDLSATLSMDPGYVSRIVRRFETDGLLSRRAAPDDARRAHLRLTRAGKAAFAALDKRQHAAIAGMLAPLGDDGASRLVAAMQTMTTLLDTDAPDAGAPAPFVLRPHRPGDLGWVVWRHGVLYAREYGWDASFEGLVARIVADFVANFDPTGERSWIAERDGVNVGCVFVVRESAHVAKLRMLIVEPSARGMGLGNALVQECIRFARAAGYRELVLWTNDILHAARHLYVKAGFTLTSEERHESFGVALVGQHWSLTL